MLVLKFFLKTIAIKWLKTVDSNQFIYTSLKGLPFAARLVFYIGFPIFTWYALSMLAMMASSFNYITVNPLFGFIIDIAFASIFTLSFLFFSYEAIYKIDITFELKAIKEKKQEIKEHKQEWWRLRNNPFWVRALIYIFVYVVCINIIQTQVAIALVHVQDLHYDLTIINQAKRDFNVFVQWFTAIFILLTMLIEWSLKRARGNRNA